MNKIQFLEHHKHLNLAKDELEKKWKIHEAEEADRERLFKQRMYEALAQSGKMAAASSVSAGGAGGGGGSAPAGAEGETFMTFVRNDSDNWQYMVADSGAGTITDFKDSGVPSGWDVNWYLNPVQKKGYVIAFENGSERAFLLLSAGGDLLKTFTPTVSLWDGEDADGRAVIFWYPTDGGWTFVFFDGENYKETFLAGEIDFIQSGSDWDDSTIDGKVAATIHYSNGDRSVRLFDVNGDVEIFFYESGSNIVESLSAYAFGSFVSLLLYDQGTNQYQSFKIFDTSGNLKENIDLTFAPLNSQNFSFYGTDKLQVVFWADDASYDWRIYNYNGSTGTLISTSQERNLYSNIDARYENRYPTDEFDSNPESIITFFYSAETSNGYFTYNGHAKVLYLFDENSEYQLYVLNNSGDDNKGFASFLYPPTSASIPIILDLDDGFVSNLVLLPNGTSNLVQMAQFSDMYDDTSFDGFNCANRIGFRYNQSGNTGVVYKLFSPTGTLITAITTTVDSYEETQYDSMWIRQYGGEDKLWYFNNSVSVFTEILNHSSFNDREPFFQFPNNTSLGTTLFYFYDIPSVRLLTKDSVFFAELLLPTTTDQQQAFIGKQNFGYYYNDDDSNTVINLYDYNGSLSNTLTVASSSVWTYYAVEDRYIFIFNNGINYDVYMITPTTTKSVTISNVTYDVRMVNDFAYWDD